MKQDQDPGYAAVCTLAKQRFGTLQAFQDALFEEEFPQQKAVLSDAEQAKREEKKKKYRGQFRNYSYRGLPREWPFLLKIFKVLLTPEDGDTDHRYYRPKHIVDCLHKIGYPFDVLQALTRHFNNEDDWFHALEPYLPQLVVSHDRISQNSGLPDSSVAWQRLAGVVRNLDRLPKPAPLPPGSSVPAMVRRSDHSIERHATMREVCAKLFNRSVDTRTGNCIVLVGNEGAGKSHLTCELVYRYGAYVRGVFWLNCTDPLRIPEQVVRCSTVDGLNIVDPSFDMLPWYDQISEIRKHWGYGLPRLVVFDHCDDPEILREYGPLKGTAGCFIIITTSRADKWKETGLPIVEVQPLTDSEARVLLSTYDVSNTSELSKLVHKVGNRPLALKLIGNYISVDPAKRKERAEMLLQELQSWPSPYTDSTSMPDEARGQSQPEVLDRIVQLSIASLDREDTIDLYAKELLPRAACFADGEPIPEDLLLATVTTGDGSGMRVYAKNALRRLLDLGLLFSGDASQVEMHPMTARIVRTVLVDAEVEQAVEAAVATRANDIKHDVQAIRLFLTHLRSTTNRALARHSSLAPQLCSLAGYHFWRVAKYDEAMYYLGHEYTLIEAQPECPLELFTENLSLRGLVYQIKGIYTAALPLFREALDRCQQASDCPPFIIVESEQNFGYLKLLQGDLREGHEVLMNALDRQLTAVEAWRSQTTSKHSAEEERKQDAHTGRCHHYLGFSWLLQGCYDEASRELQTALTIRERCYAEPSLEIAMTLHMLGELSFALGNYDRSWMYHDRARRMQEAVYGTRHHDVSESYASLGRVKVALDDISVGINYLTQALHLNQSLLGDHRETVYIHVGLAEAFLSQREPAKAEQYLNEALRIQLKLVGEVHPDTATVRDLLGRCFLLDNDCDRAEEHVLGALAVREQVLGPDHPDVAESLLNSATLYEQRRDFEAARSCVSRALSICAARTPNHERLKRCRERWRKLQERG